MALYDGISRFDLMGLAVKALVDANTVAGPRVFEPRNWPTTIDLFPVILVQTPIESKEGLYPGQLTFTTSIHLVVLGRVVSSSEGATNTALNVIGGQIENALMTSASFMGAVQQLVNVETRLTVTTEGKHHLGEIGVTFVCEVYQSYGAIGDPLIEITGTIAVSPITPPFIVQLPAPGVAGYVRKAWQWFRR